VTRVIAGASRGRRLAVPEGKSTRPTADRVKEAMFSALEAMVGSLSGRRFVDLYAGSGAVGLEALSRGAGHVALVESDARAVRVIRSNVQAVGLAGVEVHAVPVERYVASGAPSAPYDVVFADPPYSLPDDDLRAVLTGLCGLGWLAPGAVTVVERATRGGPCPWPPDVGGQRSRSYGEATLWYGRAAASGSSPRMSQSPCGPPTEE
jgi:16S rRNA (guanine966-N2)-methyltransferase